MGCLENSVQTNDQGKENINQINNLAEQQMNAAERIGDLGGQIIKSAAQQRINNAQSQIENAQNEIKTKGKNMKS